MNKRAVLSLLLVLMLFSVACSLGELPPRRSADVKPSPTPSVESSDEPEVLSIFSLLRSGPITTFHSWLTPESQQRISAEEIRDRSARLNKTLGIKYVKLSDLTKLERASDNSIAVYESMMVFDTAYGVMERPVTMTFLRNAATGRWELDWSPSLLFPGLNEENDVVIEIEQGRRGNLYDRNMKPLAVDGEVKTVGAVAGSYNRDNDENVAKLLGITVERIDELLSQSWVGDGMFVPLFSSVTLTPEQVGKLPQYSLTVRNSPTRVYPEDDLFAHLVGYVGEVTGDDIASEDGSYYVAGDLIGKRGLELLFEERLRPKKGITVFLSGRERQILYQSDPGDGEDIVLTVDTELQRHLYDMLKEEESQAVAVHPMTGQILALVSTPSFSPNAFVHGMSDGEYSALVNDPALPMLNRFQLRYAPGSTAKVLTFLAGFNTGVIDEYTIKDIQGDRWQPDESWGGYHVIRLIQYDYPQDPEMALINSDNIFFAQVAVEAGAARFTEQMRHFGVTEEVPCEYPFDEAQLSNDGTLENEVLLADAAFGQGEFQITALQMATIFGSIVNGGDVYEPYLVKAREPQIWKSQIATPHTFDVLRQAMRKLISTAYVDTVERPYAELAGKTGTAETTFDETLNRRSEDSWFIGFDIRNPSFVLAIQIQNIHRQEERVTGAMRFAEAFDRIYREGAAPYVPSP